MGGGVRRLDQGSCLGSSSILIKIAIMTQPRQAGCAAATGSRATPVRAHFIGRSFLCTNMTPSLDSAAPHSWCSTSTTSQVTCPCPNVLTGLGAEVNSRYVVPWLLQLSDSLRGESWSWRRRRVRRDMKQRQPAMLTM